MNYNFEKDVEILEKYYQKNKKLKIALLCGPKSFEDAVYFDQLPFAKISSGFIFQKLKKLGFEVKLIKNTSSGLERKLNWADVIFVNMHGEFGEDGAIQGFLTYIGKPFTGSGIFTNALTIDKVLFKEFVSKMGYSTPKYFLSENLNNIIDKDLPLILKLRRGGSSIGMYKVGSFRQYKSILQEILQKQQKQDYFAEKFITGRDLTVSIIDLPEQLAVLPILEIKTLFNDEKTKIQSQKGEHVAEYDVPAAIDDSTTKKISDVALDIYKQAKCSGFARIDFILEKNNNFHFLELNSIPGLQKESNFLMCALAGNLPADLVLLALLYNALKRNKF